MYVGVPALLFAIFYVVSHRERSENEILYDYYRTPQGISLGFCQNVHLEYMYVCPPLPALLAACARAAHEREGHDLPAV